MSYLLGFPTPVVEAILILLGIVVASAIYYGVNFESVEELQKQSENESTLTEEFK